MTALPYIAAGAIVALVVAVFVLFWDWLWKLIEETK